MRSGMRMVIRRKLFARMRSRYSRFAMSQTLCIDIFSYSFDEDLFKRGFHDFEADDSGAALGGCYEERLSVRVCAIDATKLDLRLSTIVLCEFDAGVGEEGIVSLE